MLKRALEVRGYYVIEAINGLEAIEIAKLRSPHLFIVDLNMPKLDGLETVKQLRKLDDWSQIPIIAVTAFDVYGMEQAALEMGCNKYLSKPIDLDDLDRAMKGLGFLV
jgi:two-component system cell cycle response regulator DivK